MHLRFAAAALFVRRKGVNEAVKFYYFFQLLCDFQHVTSLSALLFSHPVGIKTHALINTQVAFRIKREHG